MFLILLGGFACSYVIPYLEVEQILRCVIKFHRGMHFEILIESSDEASRILFEHSSIGQNTSMLRNSTQKCNRPLKVTLLVVRT